MKMVKSLLLGTAAGLVAMAGAQAADLPVKAKPVQYVKICSLYGAGFFYIPGTDTCIKVGGFVRTEWNANANGSFAPYTVDLQTRGTLWVRNRTRALVTFDARSQTAYGTLRSYARAAWQWTENDNQVGGSQGATLVPGAVQSSPTGAILGSSSTTYLDRAFIQLGGFTWGKTNSFFDFFNTAGYSLQTNWMWVDTGGSGTPVFAYTASFGNGVSATISAESSTESKLPIVAVGATTATGLVSIAGVPAVNTNLGLAIGSTSINSNAGNLVPDFVGNLRVDQAWGSAQVMLALHDNRANYYYNDAALTSQAGQGNHPGSAWGWAGGGGATFNLPMLGAGDTFSFMGTYCSGASRYCSNPGGGITGSGAYYGLRSGGTVGLAWIEDAYYNASNAAGGGLELPRMYSLVAGLNHKWNPAWQTSLYGGYINYRANSATVNAGTTQSCAALGFAAGCRDFSAWQIGSRTLWNPVVNLDIGVDVLYHRVHSAYGGGVIASGSAGLTSPLAIGDVDAWAGILRFQRNFWP